MKLPKLTDLEERCCREYLVNGGNQSEALRTCHKTSRKWKESTVWSKASAIFAKPQVKAYLVELKERAKDQAEKKLDITVERVLREFAKVGFSDVRRIFTDQGQLKGPASLDDDTAASIASIEVVASSHMGADGLIEIEYTHKIKNYDKLRALENLGKWLQIYTPGDAEKNDQEEYRYKGTRLPSWMKEMIPNGEG